MSISAYAIIFVLALARYNAAIIGSNCQESKCPAGLLCVDANNELCNSEKTLNCQCKIANDPALIVGFHRSLQRATDTVQALPIAQDGTPSADPIWSHSFDTYNEIIRVDVDNIREQAYIYHSGAKAIFKNANYKFGNSTENVWMTLHKGISDDYLSIAEDWISHNIYWTDPRFKWIIVQSLVVNDSSMFRVLIDENLEGPRALALDPKEALLFWSDVGTFTKIEVSSLSGRNRRTLLWSNLRYTYSMAADYEDRRLYFIDSILDTVETVTYDGNDRKILQRNIIGDFVDLTVFMDYLYVTGFRKITFINKTNGDVLGVSKKLKPGYFYSGVAVMHHDIQPSSVIAHCVNFGCEHICLTEKNGSTCICKDGYYLNQDMKTCSLKNKYFHRALVFSNKSSICIVDIRVLSDFVFDPVCVLETIGTKYMIMDTEGRQIIIANDTAIYWASVDNPELRRLTEPNGTISGMAWDGYDRILYWTEVDTGKILRMSIETQHVQVFLEGLTNPRDIMILPHDRLVYWISGRNGTTIESSDIGGSNLHVVLNYEDSFYLKSLSYNQYSKRIYFLAISDENATDIISCNLYGSDKYTFHSAENVLERLQIFKGYLLVTGQEAEETLIRILSLTDPLITSSGVFKGTRAISDIKIFDENNHQNETGPCYISNGECEQICIANGRSRVCKCMFGFRLAGDGKTCISDLVKDNFMLVGDNSNSKIYQISLNDQSVQGIKADGVYTSIYDPVHERFLWSTHTNNDIFSIHLNGTGKKRFKLSRSAFRFGVDYSTGNIYYTSRNEMNPEENYISVLSPDGKNLDLLKRPNFIDELVLYPSEGYMFYIHAYSLERASMDGSGSEILLGGLQWTDGLSIDYKHGYLYWIELSENSYNIKYCKTDGTNQSTLYSITLKALNFFHPKNLAVYEDNLFISLRKQSGLLKLKISSPNELTNLTVDGALGRIEDISIYSSAAQNKNAFCSVGNGNCATFCLPVPGGGKCACEDDVDLKEESTSACSNMKCEDPV